MIVLGLTGSIGMGKTTTAEMFEALGVPVHSADAAVHRLYAGAAAPLVEAAFPGTVRDGAVDRAALGEAVLGDASRLKALKAIVHPLVRAEEDAFLARAKASGRDIALLDIPLLYETGGEARCDAVVVVTASPEIQRKRVLARPGMSEERLAAILAQQMPDAEKRRRADFVIDTGGGLDAAREQVRAVAAALAVRGTIGNAQ